MSWWGRLKGTRQALKRPAQSAVAWALTLPLDRRPRTLADLDRLRPRVIVASRTDFIGDLLLATPLLWALHRRWPDARLVVIPGPRNRSVLAGIPFAEEGPAFRRDPLSWSELAWWLGRRRFELSVSLRAESMAGVWVAALSRAPVRMATHRTYAHPAANLLLGIDDFHQATRYCRAAALLGFTPERIAPIFVVPAEAERRAAELAPSFLPSGAEPVVGFQIPRWGSRRHAPRAWPLENAVALVRALAADGCRVVLCGTGAERGQAESIRAAVPEAIVAPPVPLPVFAALQRRFRLFVAQYTGTLHLADAVGVPTVGFGRDDQVRGWRVIGPEHRSIGAPRVDAIAVDTVLDAARSALGRRSG
jgi:ADP-heptose:LPS heptosyltransferase